MGIVILVRNLICIKGNSNNKNRKLIFFSSELKISIAQHIRMNVKNVSEQLCIAVALNSALNFSIPLDS